MSIVTFSRRSEFDLVSIFGPYFNLRIEIGFLFFQHCFPLWLFHFSHFPPVRRPHHCHVLFDHVRVSVGTRGQIWSRYHLVAFLKSISVLCCSLSWGPIPFNLFPPRRGDLFPGFPEYFLLTYLLRGSIYLFMTRKVYSSALGAFQMSALINWLNLFVASIINLSDVRSCNYGKTNTRQMEFIIYQS